MNLGKMHLLAVVTALTLGSLGWTQDVTVVPPRGTGQPAFSNNPDPIPPPQFAPDSKTGRNVKYPFGPEDEKMCPAGNAFSNPCETIPGGVFTPTVYGSLGGLALRRTGLNSTDVASIAPALGFTNPTLVNVQSIPINFNYGIAAEIGVVVGGGAIELSGFYLFGSPGNYTATPTTQATGPITAFFSSSLPSFKDVWKDVSQVNMSYAVSTGNLELNYRYPFAQGLDFLVGLRYMYIRENISIGTENDIGSTNYAFAVTDQIVAPQIGVEFEYPLIPHFSVSFETKGALGATFSDISHTLTQGNGVTGPGGSSNITQAAGIVELGLFGHIWFHERLKLRLGYEALWVLNIPEAQRQINSNTDLPLGNQQNQGSIFFHGPIIEFQLAF